VPAIDLRPTFSTTARADADDGRDDRSEGTNGRSRPSRSDSIITYVPAWISVTIGSARASNSVEVPADDTIVVSKPAPSIATLASALPPAVRANFSPRSSSSARIRPS
jgi:hypothetical protein